MKAIWCVLFLGWASVAFAGDISNDVRRGTQSPSSGNFFEVGLGVEVARSPLYGLPEGNTKGQTFTNLFLDLNSRVQYKGFFMEVFSQSLEQLTLGYNFVNTEKWSLDLVSLQEHNEISAKESKDLKGIRTRLGDYMYGPRVTAYFGNNIVQLHALTDMSDTHNGQVYSAKIGHFWQYKNWNFHGIAGLNYRTRAVADYYLSVEAEDATEKFPEFQANSGTSYVMELGATYPLSQQWVFRSLIRHVELPHQWSQSPLLISNQGTVIASSVSYVF